MITACVFLSCLIKSSNICRGYCSTKSMRETNLTHKSTFFIEYVLEKSDLEDFFRKHVACFAIDSLTNLMNGPNVAVPAKGNNTTASNSSLATTTTATPTPTPIGKESTKDVLPNPTTVWYSQEVSCVNILKGFTFIIINNWSSNWL